MVPKEKKRESCQGYCLTKKKEWEGGGRDFQSCSDQEKMPKEPGKKGKSLGKKREKKGRITVEGTNQRKRPKKSSFGRRQKDADLQGTTRAKKEIEGKNRQTVAMPEDVKEEDE